MKKHCSGCLELKEISEANFRRINRRDKPAWKARCLVCERAQARKRWKDTGADSRRDKDHVGDNPTGCRQPELNWSLKSYNSYKELNTWLATPTPTTH